MVIGITGRLALGAILALTLAACEQTTAKDPGNTQVPGGAATSVKLIERDVESPDIFQVTEPGLWDGRPSLGGVWVAHPSAKNPERVIIRNEKNGKFVIGSLFRRELNNPGPKLQVSSDAANALGILAGQPATLNVTALRKEEVPVAPQPSAATALESNDIAARPLDPIASAAAAIDAVEGKAAAAATGSQVATATPKALPSKLGKPYIQLGIFSIEGNANRTADKMRSAGVVPKVLKQESKGKTFWRVIVGPLSSKSDLTALLKKVKGLGFEDAYFVSN